jgi:hypothetical protein
MARTHRKYSQSKVKTAANREEKKLNAINFDDQIDEQISGYKISGKQRWKRQYSPDFDYDDWS